jgi:FtsH-binding integral membrane protein
LLSALSFFLLTVALHALVLYYVVDFEELIKAQVPCGSIHNEAQLAVMTELKAFNEKWGKAFQFATLPFFAFSLGYCLEKEANVIS